MIDAVLQATPLFWPGTLVSVIAGLLCRRSLGRRLGSTPLTAFFLVLSLGGIITLTLLPDLRDQYLDSVRYAEPDWATNWHIPRPAELATANQESLNVALFVPLGAVITRIRPWTRALVLAAGAAVLPFGIETVQHAAPWLLRAPDAQDIASNLLGLVLGLTAFSVLSVLSVLVRLLLPSAGGGRKSRTVSAPRAKRLVPALPEHHRLPVPTPPTGAGSARPELLTPRRGPWPEDV
ncbi:VanZ family protein [Streptomyces sp. NPDC101165]|uniref:VanZ family protein n=1 Tax=Streptomyces sp. NPDC101165 TaxID=3366119 RepID=UPI0038099738